MNEMRYISGAVRQFSLWFANGTIGYPLLEGIEDYYKTIQEENSFVEQAFAVFMNNLQLDEMGNVMNYKHCEKRAAQYVKSYFDTTYIVDPAFEEWELELHPVSKESYAY